MYNKKNDESTKQWENGKTGNIKINTNVKY